MPLIDQVDARQLVDVVTAMKVNRVGNPIYYSLVATEFARKHAAKKGTENLVSVFDKCNFVSAVANGNVDSNSILKTV